MSAAQLAPEFKLPKGKPVLLMIGSISAHGLDNAFDQIKREFGARARFIKLDWSSTDGKDAAREFSIQNPPAFVLADAKGGVLAKTEGTIDASSMRATLKALAGKSKR